MDLSCGILDNDDEYTDKHPKRYRLVFSSNQPMHQTHRGWAFVACLAALNAQPDKKKGRGFCNRGRVNWILNYATRSRPVPRHDPTRSVEEVRVEPGGAYPSSCYLLFVRSGHFD
jgi:hypothetical protein